MSSDDILEIQNRGRDIEDNSPSRSSASSSYVPNTGSAARDYCTIERTLLSFSRLGLVLLLLSASLLLKARLPDPDDGSDDDTSGAASLPLGSIYAVVSILAIISGWLGYESDLKGLLEERGFVGGFQFTEAVVVLVALLLFATCVLLLRAEYTVQ